ncbi:MAG TPA: acetyl-CoA carboxylase carboxyltransferase subunit alpha [Aestuariivirgaceae bacterium]|nr:acetyl-CoA carboxylase carboxyltransferase subunit alpha [Aestuariivirgaceae bacterium]
MPTYLDFEASVAEFEGKIAELKALAAQDENMSIEEEVKQLERKAAKSLADLYASLAPWQKAQVARHPERPHTIDYVAGLFTEFTGLAGDRKYGDDQAIIGGPARLRGDPVMIIGQEKGSDTQSRLKHNFGMARPEGYRKAVRLMEMANRFGLPIITFIDTAGAYPGIGAEERGQAEAIARSTDCCLSVGVPIIAVIIGEGGSGGAVAIATANTLLMLEHAIYSVISPEGAASILWRDSQRARDAATAMKITSADMKKLGIIEEIIEEPVGGAHRAKEAAIARTGDAIAKALSDLKPLSAEELRKHRREKFLSIGRNL